MEGREGPICREPEPEAPRSLPRGRRLWCPSACKPLPHKSPRNVGWHGWVTSGRAMPTIRLLETGEASPGYAQSCPEKGDPQWGEDGEGC